jgi:hypothetical protein
MMSRVAAIAKTPSANVSSRAVFIGVLFSREPFRVLVAGDSSLKRIAEFAEREFGEPG